MPTTACTAQRAQPTHLHAVRAELPAVLSQQSCRCIPHVCVLLGIDGQAKHGLQAARPNLQGGGQQLQWLLCRSSCDQCAAMARLQNHIRCPHTRILAYHAVCPFVPAARSAALRTATAPLRPKINQPTHLSPSPTHYLRPGAWHCGLGQRPPLLPRPIRLRFWLLGVVWRLQRLAAFAKRKQEVRQSERG